MTSFLCFVTPQYGHINPTLAVVQELVACGDTVVYYATEEFRPSIEATGAIFKPYTSIVTRIWAHMTYTGNNPQDNPFIRMGYETIEECQHVLAQIKDDAFAQHADYILYDSALGKICVELLGLPAIQFRSTYAFNQEFNLLVEQFQSLANGENAEAFFAVSKAFNDFCLSQHLAPLPFSSLFMRIEPVNIVFLPRVLQPASDSFDDRFVFVGPSIRPRFNPSGFPLEKLQRRPTLYISLGTIFSNQHQITFIRDCFQAFQDSDWQVVQSIGKEIDRALLEPVPENFLVYRHVPQLDVLQRTDVFITHGGMNSVMEALYYGIPLVVVPQMPEQVLTAQQIAGQGLGLLLDKDQLTATRLQEAVTEIYEDPTFRANAREMQAIIHASGGYRKAVEAIQLFVAHGR